MLVFHNNVTVFSVSAAFNSVVSTYKYIMYCVVHNHMCSKIVHVIQGPDTPATCRVEHSAKTNTPDC